MAPYVPVILYYRDSDDGSSSSTSTSPSMGPSTQSSFTPTPTSTLAAASSAASTISPPSGPPTSELSKTVLEYIFAMTALFLIGSLLLWRYGRVRSASASHARQSRPLTYSIGDHRTRRTSVPNRTIANHYRLPLSTALHYHPTITAPPAAHRGTRPTRGADIDSGGRRGGRRELDDGEAAAVDEDDELPVYDNTNRPPKYFELEMASYGVPTGRIEGFNASVTEAPFLPPPPIDAPVLLHHSLAERDTDSIFRGQESTAPGRDNLYS